MSGLSVYRAWLVGSQHPWVKSCHCAFERSERSDVCEFFTRACSKSIQVEVLFRTRRQQTSDSATPD